MDNSDSEVMKAIQILRKYDFFDIQRLGFNFQRADFYSPINDVSFLKENRDLWENSREILGIDWNVSEQLNNLALISPYMNELLDIPVDITGSEIQYCWNNPMWNNADALVQYGLYRHFKPALIVEIGCGWSSLLMVKAIQMNNQVTDVIQIEPYPRPELRDFWPKEWTLYETPLQRAPLEVFSKLKSGDVCFFDGSHCSKTASDVNWLFFEVLPRLASGVFIHFHDIFLPNDYPTDWLLNRNQSWNEQYVLRAFLMNNECYEVVCANAYLYMKHREEVVKCFSGIQPPYGCSFWIRKK